MFYYIATVVNKTYILKIHPEGSRAIAPEKNAPNPKTNPNSNPNPNPNLGPIVRIPFQGIVFPISSLKFLFMRFGRTHKTVRSSHQRYSLRKGVLKNFGNFERKHLCWILFFNKVARKQPPRVFYK